MTGESFSQFDEHLALIRDLSKPGGVLASNGVNATTKNPEWWEGDMPTPERDELHEQILHELRTRQPDVVQDRKAYVLAGPPGAGKGIVKRDLIRERALTYLDIDADEFKRALLMRAIVDGSYQRWIKPDVIRKHEQKGERFFPLELSSLVHEESARLAKAARDDAIARGDNIIVDTVLSDTARALELGEQFLNAEYEIHVIDIEVPFELSQERIKERWRGPYEAAVNGQDVLGGRWVPSDFARYVFDGRGGVPKSVEAARALADACPAVTRYQQYFTTFEEDAEARSRGELAVPQIVLDLCRATRGGALIETESTR